MPTPPPSLPRWAWLVPGVVAAVCYVLTLGNGFPYDDTLIVRDNWFLRDPAAVVHLATPKYFESGENSWRPAATASHWAEIQLLGAPPVPASGIAEARAAQPVPWDAVPGAPSAALFHFNNVCLHAAVCVLLALVAAQWAPTAARGPTALLAGLLMAVHPAASETVCVISFREDLLAGMGSLLALWCLHPSQPRTRRWLIAGWCGAAVAIFAKESAILLPVLLVLSHQLARPTLNGDAPDRPKEPIEAPAPAAPTPGLSPAAVYGPVAVMAVIYLLGRLVLLRSPMEPIYAGLAPEFGYRMLALPAVWVAHCTQLLCPLWLNADHFIVPVTGLADPRVWLGAGLLAIAGWAWWRAWRARWAPGILGGLLIVMTYAPVSGVLPLPNAFAERYLYVEIVGLAWMAGAAAGAWWTRLGGHRLPFASAAVVLLGGLGVRTMVRVPDWKDSDTIWAVTRASGVQSMRGYANRTSLAEATRDWDGWAQAATEWKAWADQWPAGAGSWGFSATLSLGQSYRRKAYDQIEAGVDATVALDTAERWLREAYAQHPDHPLTREEMGVLERLRKNLPESERWFRAAVEAGRPNNARQRTALAELLVEAGRLDEGIAEMERALALNPGTHYLLFALATQLVRRAEQQGGAVDGVARSADGAAAADLWRRAMEVNPWDVDSRANLGLYHLSRGEPALAAEPLLQAWTLRRYEERHVLAARQALDAWNAAEPGAPAMRALITTYGRP